MTRQKTIARLEPQREERGKYGEKETERGECERDYCVHVTRERGGKEY